MKKTIIFSLIFFGFISMGHGQRNEISIGTMLASKGKSVFGEYEYRTKLLNQKLGIGLWGFYESRIVERKQAALIPVVNYYFIDRQKGNFYIGLGYGFGYIDTLNEGKQNKANLKGQLGFNLKLYKNLFFFTEFSNLVFDDNFPNPNYGFNIKF
jgi:hypothetical protein